MFAELDESHFVQGDSLPGMGIKLVRAGRSRSGRPKHQVLGYYATLEHALRGYLNNTVRDCDARTVDDLLTTLNEIGGVIRRVGRPRVTTSRRNNHGRMEKEKRYDSMAA